MIENYLTRRNFRLLVAVYLFLTLFLHYIDTAWPNTGLSGVLVEHNELVDSKPVSDMTAAAAIFILLSFLYCVFGLFKFWNHCRYIFVALIVLSFASESILEYMAPTLVWLIGNYYISVLEGILLVVMFLSPIDRHFRSGAQAGQE